MICLIINTGEQGSINRCIFILLRQRAGTQRDGPGRGTVAISGFAGCWVIRGAQVDLGGEAGDGVHVSLGSGFPGTHAWKSPPSWTFGFVVFSLGVIF